MAEGYKAFVKLDQSFVGLILAVVVLFIVFGRLLPVQWLCHPALKTFTRPNRWHTCMFAPPIRRPTCMSYCRRLHALDVRARTRQFVRIEGEERVELGGH